MERYGATAILDQFQLAEEVANPKVVATAIQHRRHVRHVIFLERMPIHYLETRLL